MNTTELQQGSDDWFNARIGRITASNVGAILGLSPFRTRNDVMRSMVREWNGALSEFVGNVATEYGNFNENLARIDYEIRTGNVVELVGFQAAGFDESKWGWIGASPDGLIGTDKIVEFKCPFSLRKGGEFNSISEQLHYYAQIQIQMFVWCVLECDFVQWHKDDLMIETVLYDEFYIESILPVLREFYDAYLIERDAPHNEKHLRSRHASVTDSMINYRVKEYQQLKSEIKAKNELADLLLQQIVSDCGESESQFYDAKLTLIKRKTIHYKNALSELLPDADLSGFESITEYWVLK